MNGQLDLRIIAQPYSAVYWGYFRRLVFGNSLTKHIKLSSFSYSAVIFFLPISHIPPCFHANPPDFPRLIGPRVIGMKAPENGRVGESRGESPGNGKWWRLFQNVQNCRGESQWIASRVTLGWKPNSIVTQTVLAWNGRDPNGNSVPWTGLKRLERCSDGDNLIWCKYLMFYPT